MTTEILIENLEKSFDFINEVLLVNGKHATHLEELRRNCQKIADSIPEITLWAKECDFREVQANGYWTFIKIIAKFYEMVENGIRNKNSYPLDTNLVTLSSGLVAYLDKLFEIREKCLLDENHNERKKLFAAHCQQITQYFTDYCEGSKFNEIKTIYSHFNGFWYSWSQANVLQVFSYIVALLAKFPESISTLWDSKYRGEVLFEVMRNATVEFPFSVWGVADWKAHTKLLVPLLNIWNRVQTSTVFIPRQGTWILPDWTEGRVQRKYLSELRETRSKVRCRLLKSKSSGQHIDTLVFHIHGGGFVTHSPDGHEMYLRQWAANIGGAPILSVDYTLKVKYPVALQEVLDVYLWTLSGQPEVKEMLGFQPKKIVVCGDSAGGILGMALSAVLVDIRKELQDNQESFNLIMPSSFVGIYTPFNFNCVAPSLVLSTIEPILALGPLLACLGQYIAGIRYQDDYEEIKKERTKQEKGVKFEKAVSSALAQLPTTDWSIETLSGEVIRKVKHTLQQLMPWTKKPWYNCDTQELDDRLEYIHTVAKHPYIDSMSEELVDSLKDMKVYLITSHYDIFLDHNVEFAKIWRGDIKLDVVDQVPHGFLHWGFVSKEAQAASDLCLKRLQQAIGFH